MKTRVRNACDDQEMISDSQFSSIAGTSELTDLGDLAELGNTKRKEKGKSKVKPRK